MFVPQSETESFKGRKLGYNLKIYANFLETCSSST